MSDYESTDKKEYLRYRADDEGNLQYIDEGGTRVVDLLEKQNEILERMLYKLGRIASELEIIRLRR